MKPLVVKGYGDNAPTAHLYYGLDVIDALKLLPEASVQTVCTSPPYWGLRDYGTGDAQIGLEGTLDEYVAKLVAVFREVARVLRPDGTLWLNLGDSYSGGGGFSPESPSNQKGRKQTTIGGASKRLFKSNKRRPAASLKQKDLVGIPWRVAFALQADGWYLRSDIIWAKSNPMPESVRDRPTRAHEYVFLFAHPDSGGKYFYDIYAIREPFADARQGRDGGKKGSVRNVGGRKDGYTNPGNIDPSANGGKNKRSWWNINPKPYKGAHFACWPPDLVRPMILAGSSEHGACSTCGAPWKRVVDRVPVVVDAVDSGNRKKLHGPTYSRHKQSIPGGQTLVSTRVVGESWAPICECPEHEPVRSVVLDPFSGSATTGMVALQEGRDYIGIDLNAEYLPLAKARVLGEKAPPQEKDDGEDLIGDLFL